MRVNKTELTPWSSILIKEISIAVVKSITKQNIISKVEKITFVLCFNGKSLNGLTFFFSIQYKMKIRD